MTKRYNLVVSEERVREALTGHLQALSVIDDNEKVTKFLRVPEGLEVKVEKED